MKSERYLKHIERLIRQRPSSGPSLRSYGELAHLMIQTEPAHQPKTAMNEHLQINGKPWNPKCPVISWAPKNNGGKGHWEGDVPDGGWPPMRHPDGTPNPETRYPFIMNPEGHARIFGPGRADGPFPEHYEAIECPVGGNPFSAQLTNPVAVTYDTQMDIYKTSDPRYPIVCTTFRVCEQWQTGVMTRWQPWLLETEPQLFVEMSKELAGMKGIKNGEKVMVESAHGKLEAVAVVTLRLSPFKICGHIIHQVGLPWHYGWVHPKDGGDSVNILTPSSGDPNTRIPETKAFMVNVKKA